LRAYEVSAVATRAIDAGDTATLGKMAACLERRKLRAVARTAHRESIVARRLADETPAVRRLFLCRKRIAAVTSVASDP
jgi:hypothetical protein